MSTNKTQNELCIECDNENLENIINLIKNGYDINYNNSEPIKIACRKDNITIINYLIQNGANKNHGAIEAAKNGKLKILEHLFNNGATTKYECYIEAMRYGHLHIIYKLYY